MIIALTAAPALCALLLRGHEVREEAAWISRLKFWQTSAVHGVGKHFKLTAGILIVLVVAAIAVLPLVGGTFMPDNRSAVRS